MNFAPTQAAADALLAEKRDPATIHVTGNTVIDALLATRKRVLAEPGLASGLDDLAGRFAGKRIVAVTSHRRENFGSGTEAIARSIAEIADRPDVAVVFPLHPHPPVSPAVGEGMGGPPTAPMAAPLD